MLASISSLEVKIVFCTHERNCASITSLHDFIAYQAHYFAFFTSSISHWIVTSWLTASSVCCWRPTSSVSTWVNFCFFVSTLGVHSSDKKITKKVALQLRWSGSNRMNDCNRLTVKLLAMTSCILVWVSDWDGFDVVQSMSSEICCL